MEIRAIAKSIRISPKKARPMAAALRGKASQAALNSLRFDVSKTSRILYKLIFSAVSNARNNYNIKEDNLRIKTLTVDAGPTFRRYWFRSRGSADRLLKRTSHFAVVLEEIKPSLVKKPVAVKSAAVQAPDATTEKTDDTQTRGGQPVRDLKVGSQQGVKKINTTRTTHK